MSATAILIKRDLAYYEAKLGVGMLVMYRAAKQTGQILLETGCLHA